MFERNVLLMKWISKNVISIKKHILRKSRYYPSVVFQTKRRRILRGCAWRRKTRKDKAFYKRINSFCIEVRCWKLGQSLHCLMIQSWHLLVELVNCCYWTMTC